MKDFVVARADLPRGARLWTFGTARHVADDGWTLDPGQLRAGTGFVDLELSGAIATLISPPDQVLRAASLETLYLGLRGPDSLESIAVHARIDAGSPWQEIVPPTQAASLARAPPGLAVPLAWPTAWREGKVIAESVKVVLRFRAGVERARIDRIALYPRPAATTLARTRSR